MADLSQALPRDSMSTPGFGHRKKLAVCGQGNMEHPRVCGKASPTVQIPSTEVWLPATSAPLAMSLGGSRWDKASGSPKAEQTGRGADASCAPCTDVVSGDQLPSRVSFWMRNSCLHFVVLPLREPHRNEILSFHQFGSFILQHALKTWEENTYICFHLASVQFCWGFGAKAGVVHLTASCWYAKIPQKGYLHWWKQKVTEISWAR